MECIPNFREPTLKSNKKDVCHRYSMGITRTRKSIVMAQHHTRNRTKGVSSYRLVTEISLLHELLDFTVTVNNFD